MTVPEKVPMQIEKVRNTGEVNMMNYHSVQKLAFELNHHDLVVWMEEVGIEGYGECIMTGKF